MDQALSTSGPKRSFAPRERRRDGDSGPASAKRVVEKAVSLRQRNSGARRGDAAATSGHSPPMSASFLRSTESRTARAWNVVPRRSAQRRPGSPLAQENSQFTRCRFLAHVARSPSEYPRRAPRRRRDSRCPGFRLGREPARAPRRRRDPSRPSRAGGRAEGGARAARRALTR